MNLDILQRIAAELDELLTGGFITKFHQPLPREILIRVRRPGFGERRVIMSADPQLARIHLTTLKVPNPKTPPRFCAYLRAHFQGFTVMSVCCAPDDRVVTIAACRGPEENRVHRHLVLELLGRDSNIILVDAVSGLIMDCLHHIGEGESTTRVVLPGYPYEAPPRQTGTPPTAPVEADRQLRRPGITTDAKGRSRLTILAVPDKDDVHESVNDAADALYRKKLTGRILEARKRELAKPLRTRLRSLERRLEKIDLDAARMERFAENVNYGELLKGNLHRIERGRTEVTLHDWATGEEVRIDLDPSLGPVENMERLFHRAGRGKRGTSRVRERRDVSLAEKAALEDALYYLEEADTIDEVEQWAEDHEVEKTVREKAEKEKKSDSRPRDRRITTPEGRTLYVGRSGRENDRLLRTRARPGDLWFHVHGVPGAHVLMPLREGQVPSDEEKRFAAGVAVHYSRLAGKGPVDVMVSDVKDVVKPRGSFPGQVLVRKYSTIKAESPLRAESEY